MPTDCKLDIHKETWDLGGTMTAEFFDVAGEPCYVIHEDQMLRVRVTVHLTGRILHYLCNTSIGVSVAFESCGSGPEFEVCDWKTLTPCAPGGDTYQFEFNIAGSRLGGGECGRRYELCITLGSKDCCGKVGFIFGACHDFSITVLPADVN